MLMFFDSMMVEVNKKRFVQYARVSTKKQDYGLEAQKTRMDEYVLRIGGETIKLFSEKESGKDSSRFELNNAIEFAKSNNATLLVSKLDRLSRSISFIFQLRESNVDFLVVEYPELNTLTLSIFAGVAQSERETIVERIKAGIEVSKNRGKIWGRRKGVVLSEKTKKQISDTKKQHAQKKRTEIVKLIKENKTCIKNINTLIMALKFRRIYNIKGTEYNRNTLQYLGFNKTTLKQLITTNKKIIKKIRG
jgi:DNA invertase Pin-like site-specific DNA recombinase